MALYEKRILSHKLRKQGISIVEIARTLKVSKSTASSWCKEITLSELQIKRLKNNSIKAGHKGRMMGAEINRVKKLDALTQSKKWSEKSLACLTERDVLVAATALYWSEGSKSSTSTGFQFVNSDPQMILFMKSFLEQIGVKSDEFFCSIQINRIHERRVKKVLKFWEKLLDLPSQQFSKPYFVDTKVQKIYQNYDNYYGICRLKVRKSSLLKYKMLGLISVLKLKVS